MENEAQKIISSITTDQKEVSGGDDVAMNQEGAKMEEDHQIGSGNDLALSDSSTTDQKGLKKDDASMNEGGTGSDSSSTDQKDDASMNEGGTGSDSSSTGTDSSSTDQKDDASMNEGGTGSDSSSTGTDSSSTDQKDDASMNEAGTGSDSSVNDDACRKLELSDSSRLLLASPIKRKFDWIPAKTETTSGKLYTTNLNHGEDLVDAVYQLSEAYDHRRHVSVVSATGFVSMIVFRDGISVYGTFQITSLSLQCPSDKDGRSCRNKAACSVSMTSDYGTHNWTGVNFIAVKGPIEITAELEEEKSAGESSAAAAAQDGNSDSGKAIEELEAISKKFPAAYGNTSSSRLLYLSPIKRKFEWIPAETETTSCKLYTINLNHGENVVDAVYHLSEAYNHGRLVGMVSATGSISKIAFFDGLNAYEISQITSLSLQYPADEDVRPCRKCSVSWTGDEGKTYKMTGVNYLVADVPIAITAELVEEKSAGESSAAAVAAQDGNSDSGKAIEELEALATNFPAADGNINPTSTTGAANDQNKKSPYE